MDPFRSWYQTQAPVRRSYSRSPYSFYGVPVHNVDPHRDVVHPEQQFYRPPVEEKSTQKVVRIPVQFPGSVSVYDSRRRLESAVKIQKLFRGFLVRKSLKKVREIEYQVDEIEAKLRESDVVERIRENEKERLRMNETLMNLLLKLDGIRGVDLGVRNCRKAVTKKAIALQEKVDAISADDSDERVIEFGCPAAAEDTGNHRLEAELESSANSAPGNGESEEEIIDGEDDNGKGEIEEMEGKEELAAEEELIQEPDNEDSPISETMAMEASVIQTASMKNRDEEIHSQKNPPINVAIDEDGSRIDHELMKKMTLENAKMMRMMQQLYEQNETQLQMLHTLASRVDYLEKSYLCDKLKNRRRKKKNKPAAASFCIEE